MCDLDSEEGGRRGQVFHFSAYGHSPRRVLAASFTEWLESLADDLDGGRFEVEDEGLWLSPKGNISRS